MKFNTQKYKLSLFTEDVCEDCTTLKGMLKDKNIPFNNRSITTKTIEQRKTNADNRWAFIDAEAEDGRFQWFTPVLIVEDSTGNITYIPAVSEETNCEDGKCFESLDRIDDILKPYLL
tara:strand:- start:1264 stop:1617 length:354 start_codon:yes stop_codon:yes gene_type:complete